MDNNNNTNTNTNNNKLKTLKVTLVRSPIGTKQSHRSTVRGLGLRKVNSFSMLIDTPAIRGMIHKINYLVKCE